MRPEEAEFCRLVVAILAIATAVPFVIVLHDRTAPRRIPMGPPESDPVKEKSPMSFVTFLRVLFGLVLCLLAALTPIGAVWLYSMSPWLQYHGGEGAAVASAVLATLCLGTAGIVTIAGEWPDK